jgi:hypothetical protein
MKKKITEKKKLIKQSKKEELISSLHRKTEINMERLSLRQT